MNQSRFSDQWSLDTRLDGCVRVMYLDESRGNGMGRGQIPIFVP